ncbi:response regulator [Deinococcus humi]|uniref:CheY-like chemotaxis protein n=1 Tax=Deinococcus humi TaxID=662880 RepID=A0A7W8K211_9DEIO|nr:response regulator [Deinococcus humi]MBB5365829.1 CheY-like chemotaxis protein [Deinococcus humi]
MTRVMLVEDHPVDALLLREELAALGVDWRIEEVPTFTAAAARWPGGTFELLVLDLSLPDGQGLELLGRALELSSGVPVVVLSGHAHPGLAAQTLNLGAMGYVVKDLGAATQLRDLVAQVI